MSKMNNVVDMRTELLGVFSELQAGTIELPVAQELNNTAGKILSSVKVELAKAALCDEKPAIAFLGGEKKCLPKT